MAKFNFNSNEERDRVIKRALSLKPKMEGVYATKSGYVIDRNNGTTELLVSFRNLDELLAESETSTAEFVAEVAIVAEASPVNAAIEVITENAAVEDSDEELQAVTETKEERRARRAAEKAAKAAE